MRSGIAALKAAVAAVIVAAVVAQLARTLSNVPATGRSHGFVLTNFFSFFTVESNVLSAVVLLWGAYRLLDRDPARTGAGGAHQHGRHTEPIWFATIRLSVATYMLTTGLVYNLLLRGVELPQGTTVPWSNEVLHVVGPLLVVVDWLFAPGRTPRRGAVYAAAAFPVVWAAYTMVRGRLAHWYPYPFLDPRHASGGSLTVLVYVVLIAALIIGGAALLIRARERLTSRRGRLLTR